MLQSFFSNSNSPLSPDDPTDVYEVIHEEYNLRQTFSCVQEAELSLNNYSKRNGFIFHKSQVHRLKIIDASTELKPIIDKIIYVCSKSGKKKHKRAHLESTRCPCTVTL